VRRSRVAESNYVMIDGTNIATRRYRRYSALCSNKNYDDEENVNEGNVARRSETQDRETASRLASLTLPWQHPWSMDTRGS